MKEHSIKYYDSDGDEKGGLEIFPIIREYLASEYKRITRGGILDQKEWSSMDCHKTKTLPQQENDYDCGVFVCQFVKSLVERYPMESISPKDMMNYRVEMVSTLMKHGV
jgi:Ulp1 family protease